MYSVLNFYNVFSFDAFVLPFIPFITFIALTCCGLRFAVRHDPEDEDNDPGEEFVKATSAEILRPSRRRKRTAVGNASTSRAPWRTPLRALTDLAIGKSKYRCSAPKRLGPKAARASCVRTNLGSGKQATNADAHASNERAQPRF